MEMKEILILKDKSLNIDIKNLIGLINNKVNGFIFKCDSIAIQDETITRNTYDNILINHKIKDYDSTIILTSKSYNDSSYFSQPQLISDKTVAIISFYNWEEYTNLKIENGIIYFICYGIAHMIDNHKCSNKGCIYHEFDSWFTGKYAIDIGLKVSSICESCITIIESYKKIAGTTILYTDLKNLLNDLSISWFTNQSIISYWQNGTIDSFYISQDLIDNLKGLKSSKFDLKKLIAYLDEINFNYSNKKILSCILIGRAILNHIPPIFGYEKFTEFVNNRSSTLKKLFSQLEDGFRKFGDLHSHELIDLKDNSPNFSEIETYKPHFEKLISEVIGKLKNE